MKPIVFSTLAMNQTRFFVGVARELRDRGYTVVFLCFHDRSCDYIRKHGFSVTNMFDGEANTSNLEERFQKITRDLNIENPTLLLGHEKDAYEINDSNRIKLKFCDYAERAKKALIEIQDPVLIQELGGFASVLACHFAARSLGVDSYFLEPSVFRGRVFFVKNSLKALAINDPVSPITLRAEMKAYLQNTLEKQNLVIPTKDAWQYNGVLKKIFRARSMRRLVEKSVDKYVLGKREEFEHIGQYTSKHLRMLVNKTLLQSHYKPIPEKPFIYFPLHVPADFALTIRSPEYLDQYSLLDYLARVIPSTHVLTFKEHPALVGAVDPHRVKSLLGRHDNIVMLQPFLSNYEVIKKASVIVTINSKSGAETLLCNKSVVVLGDAFYRNTKLVTRVNALQDLPQAIRSAMEKEIASDDVLQFFQAAWNQSYPGEIFEDKPENFRNFSESIDTALKGAHLLFS